MTLLRRNVETWLATCADFSALARELDPTDFDRATDLPGWTVHDIVAHSASLESELAGNPVFHADVPEGIPHVRSRIGYYTEQGVIARRDWPPRQILEEFDSSVKHRATLLASEALDDPDGTPPITPGKIGWKWGTLLRNRALDVWVHEQDIRRAVNLPGGLDTPGAAHAQSVFAAALPYAVAKVAEAPPGSSVVIDVTGPIAASYEVVVDADGRGKPADPAELKGMPPTVRLTMETETFCILGAGRRDPSVLPVRVEGDEDLAHRVLVAMNVTP